MKTTTPEDYNTAFLKYLAKSEYAKNYESESIDTPQINLHEHGVNKDWSIISLYYYNMPLSAITSFCIAFAQKFHVKIIHFYCDHDNSYYDKGEFTKNWIEIKTQFHV